jgi:hypothetical protein
VIIRFQFEGTHNWPGAPEKGEQYLAHPHRHMFHVEVRLPVAHDNRDIEFIEAGRLLRYALPEILDVGDKTYYRTRTLLELGAKSCEMIASKILGYALTFYNLRTGTCEVMEDGENGAFVQVLQEGKF